MLLENRGELPWDPAGLCSVAVMGDNAANARIQGCGGATVVPEHTVLPLEGLRAALPGVEISYSRGAMVQEGVAGLPLAQLTNLVTGWPGVWVRFLYADGARRAECLPQGRPQPATPEASATTRALAGPRGM